MTPPAIFDAPSLHHAVQLALKDADVPDGASHAFAVVGTLSGGVKGVLSTKINQTWQVDTIFSIDTHKQVDAGVQLKAIW